MPPWDDAIRAAILGLALDRGPGRSLCPSEVARALSPDWRALMPEVRRVAGALQAEGRIVVTQRGAPVDPLTAKGAIRLGLPGS
jgi:hypothetical protein